MQRERPRGQSPRHLPRTLPPAGPADDPHRSGLFYIGVNSGGVWRTTDSGRTWRHRGLRDGQQLALVIVDLLDPSRVFAAVRAVGELERAVEAARARVRRP